MDFRPDGTGWHPVLPCLTEQANPIKPPVPALVGRIGWCRAERSGAGVSENPLAYSATISILFPDGNHPTAVSRVSPVPG